MTTMGGAALMMARMRVIARQQQQQQQHLAAAAAAALAAAPPPLSSSAQRPPLFSSFSAPPARTMSSSTAADAASASASAAPATEQQEQQQQQALPPGASPLLPLREATATAARLAAAGAFSAPPTSLSFDRGVYRYPPTLEGNALGRAILRLTGSYSRRQTLRNGAVILWDAIAERGAHDPRLARAFGLDPRAFMSTWYLESLGIWLVVNRLKLEGAAEAADFQQHLYSHLYQPDVARRVRAAPGVVAPYSGKWLRRLEQVFYGMALAYDRAIVGGDGGAGAAGGEPPGADGTSAPAGARAALSRALVRNVYGGDGGYAPSADLLARYLCRQLQCLAMTPTEDLYLGQVRFGGVEGRRAGEELDVEGL